MARVFNGVTYYTSKEMSKMKDISEPMLRHYARTKKILAKRWVDGHWYFNPDEVDSALENNGYVANETGNI